MHANEIFISLSLILKALVSNYAVINLIVQNKRTFLTVLSRAEWVSHWKSREADLWWASPFLHKLGIFWWVNRYRQAHLWASCRMLGMSDTKAVLMELKELSDWTLTHFRHWLGQTGCFSGKSSYSFRDFFPTIEWVLALSSFLLHHWSADMQTKIT